MNKNKLVAQWWQYFLNDIEAPPDIHFVRARVIRPNQPEANNTFDYVELGKTLVIPVNNWISLSDHANYKMIKTAKERMNSVQDIILMINDKAVKPERVMSEFFDLDITQKNILYDFPPQLQLGRLVIGKYKALSDGYWLFSKPETSGEYKINTSSHCATGVFTLNMNHTIVIS